VSGDEGPRARSVQGIGAIANHRCEADAPTIARHFPHKEAEAL
jgi:hypothetical protein